MKKIIEQFRKKFTIPNISSYNGVWWKIPTERDKEIASPVEVEQFIKQALLDQLNECLKDAYDEELKTWDYDRIAENVLELKSLLGLEL